jgi:GAF domain-containing protein
MGVRAFAAIPLVRGRRWLGFVTLSWPTTHSFSPQERRLYSAIGPQLAAFIENRRLFEQTQAALEEIAATHRLYVRQEWADFVPAWASPFYERSRPDLPPLEGDTSSPRVQKAIAQAMEERRLISMPGGSGEAEPDVLVVPITLRGEVIGTLGLQETHGGWSDEDVTLIQTIADQMALAIETARLFEETQRRAARERVVADITARVRSSLDLDGILQTAVRELAAALNTDRAFVQLTGLPQVSSTPNLPFEDISPEEVEE